MDRLKEVSFGKNLYAKLMSSYKEALYYFKKIEDERSCIYNSPNLQSGNSFINNMNPLNMFNLNLQNNNNQIMMQNYMRMHQMFNNDPNQSNGVGVNNNSYYSYDVGNSNKK
jgi:hypothetical protein